MQARQREQVASGKILEHDVMKSRAGEIDRGAVSETIDYVWMSHAIERDCFVLKIGDKRALQFGVRFVLQVQVQRLDDDGAWRAVDGGVVVSDVDFGVTAAAKAVDDVISPVESALLEFEFRHSLRPDQMT
jgi:hypothetical protein